MNKCKQTQSADHYKKKKEFQIVNDDMLANTNINNDNLITEDDV